MTRFYVSIVAVAALGAACGEDGGGVMGLAGDEAQYGTVEQGVTVCGDGATLEGVDVSYYQGTVDWTRVAGSGRKFAIARIGDGTYKDPTFATNWAGIKRVGMIRGAYQYFRTSVDPITQADIVVAAVGKLGPGDLPVTIDVEVPNPGVSTTTYQSKIRAWIDRVKAGTGKDPIIYTGYYYWNGYVASSEWKANPLWHAQYTTASCPNISQYWADWTFWQYSSSGSVPGISGNVDVNRFNGTLAQLEKLANANSPPVGWLDSAGCDAIGGWAQDPDAPGSAIAVHVYIGGPAGDARAVGYPLKADVYRSDLCSAIGSCAHGFSLLTPLAFMDGTARAVYAYGIDSAGGANALLSGAPKSLKCARPAMPWDDKLGVKRHITSPDVMKAWGFTWNDVAKVPDTELATYAQGPDLPGAPALKQKANDAAVYLADYATLRHVTSPASMDAWSFSFGAVKPIADTDFAAKIVGAPLSARPYLAQGSGPEVWLIDAAPALWAVPKGDDAPDVLTTGQTYEVTFRIQNRGSAEWKPGAVELVTSKPRDRESAFCDPSWKSCDVVAANAASVVQTGVGSFMTKFNAPSAPGEVTECFTLRMNGHYFGENGQGGPEDGVLCKTFQVRAPEPEPEPEAQPEPAVTANPDPATTGASTPEDAGAVAAGGCGCATGGAGEQALWTFGLLALAGLGRRRT